MNEVSAEVKHCSDQKIKKAPNGSNVETSQLTTLYYDQPHSGLGTYGIYFAPIPSAYICVCLTDGVARIIFLCKFPTTLCPGVIRTHMSRVALAPGTFEGTSTD